MLTSPAGWFNQPNEMPEAGAPAQSVLAELGLVLFAREATGELRLSGKTPGWLNTLWPALGENDGLLPVAETSPFLENFLIDAEECWQKGGAERARSGPWVEQDTERRGSAARSDCDDRGRSIDPAP